MLVRHHRALTLKVFAGACALILGVDGTANLCPAGINCATALDAQPIAHAAGAESSEALHLTGAAFAISVPADGERVPRVLAPGTPRVYGVDAIPAADVLLLGDGLQVRRADAMPNAAQMVELERQVGPVRDSPGESVSFDYSQPEAHEVEATVAARFLGAGPEPAIAWAGSLADLGPKAGFVPFVEPGKISDSHRASSDQVALWSGAASVDSARPSRSVYLERSFEATSSSAPGVSYVRSHEEVEA